MSLTVKAKYMLFFSIINLASYFFIQSVMTQHEFDFMTSFDEAIPFMPEHIWIYHSMLPVIVVTTMLLIKTKRLFFSTFWSCILAAVILNLSYIYLPSHYPRPEFEITTISEVIVDMTRRIDGANNTFPSAHVTYAWILFWGVCKSKIVASIPNLKYLYLLWAIGISLSTLVLKQHYIADVGSGFSLSFACFFLVNSIFEYKNIYDDDHEQPDKRISEKNG